MDSLEAVPVPDEQETLLAGNPELAQDFWLRYALGVEMPGSACLLGEEFRDPFAHALSVVRGGVRQEVRVDMPETFNWLVGLRVEARRRIDRVLAITGTDADGKRCLILWRNLRDMSHTAVDTWFGDNHGRFSEALDLIYVNGDHTLNAMRRSGNTSTAEAIETVFRELMFRFDAAIGE